MTEAQALFTALRQSADPYAVGARHQDRHDRGAGRPLMEIVQRRAFERWRIPPR
jgi:hypothetical protein